MESSAAHTSYDNIRSNKKGVYVHVLISNINDSQVIPEIQDKPPPHCRAFFLNKLKARVNVRKWSIAEPDS